MYTEELHTIIKNACADFDKSVENSTAYWKKNITIWLAKLNKGLSLQKQIEYPDSFPLFLLPYWLEKSFKGGISEELQRDLAFSSIHMYLYVRFIDNVMDGDDVADNDILTVLNVFHSEFQRVYSKYFAYDHPFWNHFKEIWYTSGAISSEDLISNVIDEDHFRNLCGRKFCFAAIPVAAVCCLNGREDLIPHWVDFINEMSCFSQMSNDFFDWHKDSRNNNMTFFLCEAEKQRGEESIAGWVYNEGLQWGFDYMMSQIEDLKNLAEKAAISDVFTYIDQRRDILLERYDLFKKGLAGLKKIWEVVHQPL